MKTAVFACVVSAYIIKVQYPLSARNSISWIARDLFLYNYYLPDLLV